MSTYAKRSTKMTDDDIKARVGQMIDNARSFIEEQLAQDRQTATDYYWGRPYGNEEEGRSQVVTTEVRDTILRVLPSLLRIFFGSDRAVEYRGKQPEDDAGAQQATDAMQYVLEENRAFLVFHSWFKDALLRRTGFVKWWWDPTPEVEEQEFSGLSDDDLMRLLSDPEVEIPEAEIEDPPAPQMPRTYKVSVKHTRRRGKIRLEAVPPEEVLWNRNARSLNDAVIVVHSTRKRRDELVAMGYDAEDLPSSDPRTSDIEASARRFDQDQINVLDQQDPATEPVRYDEAYVYLDVDGDGIAELCKVCLAGDGHKLLQWEKVSHRPFALLCPDPEPHTVVGQSLADLTMDIQKINSAILRGTLDSLSLALLPRTIVNEQMVNLKDVLNTEMGGVIRASGDVNAAMREVRHSFVGDTTLPMLDYTNKILEHRTNQSQASQGLDADVLQSTTKAAVSATLTKAQERIEMIARIFAETGVKDLYLGLLKTLIAHQDRQLIVRLRNRYVPVDPRTWNANMDVTVNVALGAGLPEDRIQVLKEIAMDQTSIMQQLGPSNPLVSLAQLRNTRAKVVELSGYPDPTQFYKEVRPEDEQQLAQKPAAPDPNAILAQAEMIKAQSQAERTKTELALKDRELSLKEREARATDDRERDHQAAEVVLRLKELELKYHQSLDRAEVQAEVQLARAQLDADTRKAVAEIQQAP